MFNGITLYVGIEELGRMHEMLPFFLLDYGNTTDCKILFLLDVGREL
jgi:hypothetical protein